MVGLQKMTVVLFLLLSQTFLSQELQTTKMMSSPLGSRLSKHLGSTAGVPKRFQLCPEFLPGLSLCLPHWFSGRDMLGVCGLEAVVMQ